MQAKMTQHIVKLHVESNVKSDESGHDMVRQRHRSCCALHSVQQGLHAQMKLVCVL